MASVNILSPSSRLEFPQPNFQPPVRHSNLECRGHILCGTTLNTQLYHMNSRFEMGESSPGVVEVRQYLFSSLNMQKKQTFRFLALCLQMANGTTSTDIPLLLGVRAEDEQHGGFNGASNYSSFGRQQADITELAFVRESEVRAKLVRKLSAANKYTQHLQREVQERDKKLLMCRNNLTALEVQLQVLLNISQEIAKEGGKPGTRKINGRYIHYHLAHRLEELQKVILARIKDVDTVRTRKVELVFYSMAEDVQVMGSFDGWTYGKQMSPESTGTHTKFTTTVKLYPGRYEIKFLVDGDWQVSPELPTVGEGVTMNNVLVID